MVALKPIEELKRRKALLVKQQEELVDILKTKHKEAYDWMKENNIDPFDLRTYSASLAVALIVGMTAVTPGPKIPTLELPVNVIETNELTDLTEEQKADIVWKRYGHVIARNAFKYKVDPKLIYATIMLESGGDTYSIRHEPSIGDASYGLGQILYGTAIGIGFEGNPQDLYDPEVNIDLIARYHRRNQDVYGGDLTAEQLTTAYNSGSPYSYALPGHINKFHKWYDKVGNFI
jgi:soluble lytic murein transglycosylase-like protein